MDPTRRRIRKIDRDVQRFVAKALGNTDLTLSDYDMIHTIEHRPGITQEQLRKKYAQDKSTIARRAAKLEAGGYIERRPHPGDGRRKQLYITDKGRAIRNAKVEAESFYFEWLTAELTPEELGAPCWTASNSAAGMNAASSLSICWTPTPERTIRRRPRRKNCPMTHKTTPVCQAYGGIFHVLAWI